ncbi:hypothetical protein [Jiella sp. M17.18]|uniref:hypothetical protein n=1 Tax=Jiella sp. M17.18 TaxID=3234247 RepID=UPI0034DF1664
MSGGAVKPKRLKSYPEAPFVQHSKAMLESVAFRSLGWHARKIMDELEREHLAHGGHQNGRLMRTWADLRKAGVGKDSISTGLIELEALGFVEIVRQGGRSVGDFHQPNLYRLTYLKARLPDKDGKLSGREYITDEWFDVLDEEDAERRIARRKQRWEEEHGQRARPTKRSVAEPQAHHGRAA